MTQSVHTSGVRASSTHRRPQAGDLSVVAASSRRIVSRAEAFVRTANAAARSRHHRVCARGDRLEACPTRHGFTLIEVLLSLALMVLVVAAVAAGMDTLRRVTQAGRDDVLEDQVARAVERRMTDDLRSVLFVPPELPDATTDDTGTADPSAAGTGDAGATGSTDTGDTDDTLAPAEPRSIGLIGDAVTLTLHADLPGRNLDYVSPQLGPSATDRTGDLRAVTWFVSEGNLVPGSDAGGLARAELNRAGLTDAEAAEAAGDPALLADAARVLAPEITQVGFRYFDGAAWLEEWDSVTIGALPLAVEVTLAVDADGPPEQFRIVNTPNRRPAVFRFVVAMPLASPTVGGTL